MCSKFDRNKVYDSQDFAYEIQPAEDCPPPLPAAGGSAHGPRYCRGSGGEYLRENEKMIRPT